MSTNLARAAIAALSIAFGLVAVSPLHAEGPAVELEGYYTGDPRLTALDARARATRGLNLPQARVPETRQQKIDDAEHSAPSTSRDGATSPLIAHFKPTSILTRR